MMHFIVNKKWALAGILAGAIGGYAFYYFIGCASGSCPITSRPLNSTLYGVLMGWLLFSSFDKGKQNSVTNKINNDESEKDNH